MEFLRDVLLLIITYFTGRFIEYRHFQRIEAEEARTLSVPVLNIEDDFNLPHDAKIRMVAASIVLSADYFRRFLGALISLFGGSVATFESVSDRARREVILRLKAEAPDATYFTGLHFEVMRSSPGMVEILGYATAIYTQAPAYARPQGYPKPLNNLINAPRVHPLKELAIYGGIALAVLVLLYQGTGLLVDKYAERIPMQQEEWLWKQLSPRMPELRNQNVSETLLARQKQIQDIVDKLPKNDMLKDYDFRVILINDTDINAYAMPGGRIVVTTALLEAMPSENALTFVLGHELGHFIHRDHLKKFGRGLLLLGISTVFFGNHDLATEIISEIMTSMDLHFSRAQEEAADAYGLKALVHYYGHAGGAEQFFEVLDKKFKDYPGSQYFSTHPLTKDRIQFLERHAKLNDYPMRAPTKLVLVTKAGSAKDKKLFESAAQYEELYKTANAKEKAFYTQYFELPKRFESGEFFDPTAAKKALKDVKEINRLHEDYYKYRFVVWERYKEQLTLYNTTHPYEWNEARIKHCDEVLMLLKTLHNAEDSVLEAYRQFLQYVIDNPTFFKSSPNRTKVKRDAIYFYHFDESARELDRVNENLFQKRLATHYARLAYKGIINKNFGDTPSYFEFLR